MPLKRQTNYKFYFFVCCFFIWHLFSHRVHGVDGFGFVFQKYCVETIEGKSQFDNLHKKIICSYDQSPLGTESEQSVFDLFKNLGLIHLLVASGAHLIILQKGLQKVLIHFTKSKLPVYFLLSVFILCSNFNCPVTRSYCQYILTNESKKRSMGWSDINITLISSFFYVSLFPANIFSLSFWLSLCASLCLSLFTKNITLLSIGFYFGLLPFIFDFTWPTLTSIFVNVFITPWLSTLYIWNSMVYLFSEKYYLVGDHFYILTIHFLKYITNPNQNIISTSYSNFKIYKYLYGIIFLILTLYFQNLKTKKIKRHLKLNSLRSVNKNHEV